MQKRDIMPPTLWGNTPMAVEAPNILVTILAFLTLIGTLVVVHELGHYWVGRWFGVKAEKFSIGFGPQLWGRVDKRGTLWRIGALPLGGYVQFAGDMNPSSQPDENWHKMPADERNQTFQSKSLWKRALIVFAGPAINFLFAIILLSGLLMTHGRAIVEPVVSTVKADSPAAKIGLTAGDRILMVNGQNVEDFFELAREVSVYPDENIALTYSRDGKIQTQDVRIAVRVERDRFGNESRIGLLGISPVQKIVMQKAGFFEAPVLAVKETGNIIRLTLKTIGQMISGKRSVKELGGPLKIAKVSGEYYTLGLVAFIGLAAMISINLGFMNLLPIPMLDGGHLLLYAVEAVRRRPATPQVQEWAFRAGFVMLVGFMLMVTFNDLTSFGLFGR
jgi:regulator of sigma E protease